MSKYNYELKLKIAGENEAGYGLPYLAKKYVINPQIIKIWLSRYAMYGEEGLKKSMTKTDYNGEFNHYVLQYKQNHKLSYKHTAEKFGIKNISTIANWN